MIKKGLVDNAHLISLLSWEPGISIIAVFTLLNNKQLLDEVEHDIMNYQNRGLCYLRQITQTRGFDNS